MDLTQTVSFFSTNPQRTRGSAVPCWQPARLLSINKVHLVNRLRASAKVEIINQSSPELVRCHAELRKNDFQKVKLPRSALLSLSDVQVCFREKPENHSPFAWWVYFHACGDFRESGNVNVKFMIASMSFPFHNLNLLRISSRCLTYDRLGSFGSHPNGA